MSKAKQVHGSMLQIQPPHLSQGGSYFSSSSNQLLPEEQFVSAGLKRQRENWSWQASAGSP